MTHLLIPSHPKVSISTYEFLIDTNIQSMTNNADTGIQYREHTLLVLWCYMTQHFFIRYFLYQSHILQGSVKYVYIIYEITMEKCDMLNITGYYSVQNGRIM
jgi:hypothetical protein